MSIRKMKRIVIMAVVLVAAITTANTAFGKYVNSSSNAITASSSTIDVKIVERTKDCSCCTKHTSEVIDAVSTIEETVSNLVPGQTVTLDYKIINTGSIDVLLESVNVTIKSKQVKNNINLKWTITQYKDDEPINTVTHEQDMNSTVPSEQIVLGYRNHNSDYCMLELIIALDENSEVQSEALETVFIITPYFIQN